MRLGLVGPSEEDPSLLRKAARFLLDDREVEQAVYLGAESTLRSVVGAWASEIMAGGASEERFLAQAVELALGAESRAIDRLLACDREVRKLNALRCLPPPPARAVELFEDKVILFVHDKAMLDQEDIANAFLIVYGRGKRSAVHRFGPRTFFTPCPLKAGRVAVIERERDNNLAIAQFDPETGEAHGREVLPVRRSRLVVTP